MTSLSGLNARLSHQEAHAQATRQMGPAAKPTTASSLPPSRRRGSAMGASHTRSGTAADRRRRILRKGEPWDSKTISPS